MYFEIVISVEVLSNSHHYEIQIYIPNLKFDFLYQYKLFKLLNYLVPEMAKLLESRMKSAYL